MKLSSAVQDALVLFSGTALHQVILEDLLPQFLVERQLLRSRVDQVEEDAIESHDQLQRDEAQMIYELLSKKQAFVPFTKR